MNSVCAQIRPAGRGHAKVKVSLKKSQQEISVGLLIKSVRSLDPKNTQDSKVILGQESMKVTTWNQMGNCRQQC